MTLVYVRQLPSYALKKDGSPFDSHVYNLVERRMPEALNSVMEYTRGMYTLDLHYQSLKKFERSDSIPTQFYSTRMNEARNMVEDSLRASFSVRAISASAINEVHFIGSSSAGYGYIGCKRDNYKLARSRATVNLSNFRKFGSDFRFTPYKAFARTQLAQRRNPKIRHVWGAPFHTILIEGLIAQPIIKRLLLEKTPIYIGGDLFKDLPSDIVKELNLHSYAYCLDFSSFDASVPRIMIEWFFDFVSRTVSFPNQFTRSALDYCKSEILDTPILMPDGKLFICKTGIPSGSYFTQVLGSYVNLILLTYCQLSIVGHPLRTYVLGDDSIFCDESPDKLLTYKEMMKILRFTINEKKSVVSNNLSEIVFLGHNLYGSRLTRDDFTLLCLALHTEQDDDDVNITLLRLGSLYYDSGCNSFMLMNLIRDLCCFSK